MRRFGSIAAIVTAFAAASAQGQIAIYAISANTHLSNVEDGSTYTITATPGTSFLGPHANATVGTYTNQFTSFWASGIGAGITYNFIPVGPVKVGVDFRGSLRPGTPGADTAMIGFKVGLKAPLISIKPYIQASGGYVATRATNVSTTSTSSTPAGGTFNERYWAYQILGGIDYPIPYTRFLDLRLIELGGGQGYNVGGLGTSRPGISLFSVNSGLVLHF